jgi:hypothetical protein
MQVMKEEENPVLSTPGECRCSCSCWCEPTMIYASYQSSDLNSVFNVEKCQC